ncbi:nucleoside-diphosphate-sugar epimerase [Sphingobacteriaceae bacterium GW460-11-11-14-LB5]|nr:nucleoside-diphosphate-sugar epimerase [Sphingobacteriaceae bacterium GW460-11-11-14-LB5]
MIHNLILTGSSGFVGQNLTNYLTKHVNYKITSLDRVYLKNVNIEFPDGTEAIVHLAGKAHDLKNVSGANEYYEVNFELTKKLYDAFIKSDAQKFIFISSVKAVADIVDGELTENAIPSPKTHYGKSKLLAEQYIMNQQLPAGKSYYILRPCMIHGPGNKGNLNLLFQFVKRGIPYPLAAFKNKRSFLSVDNLCFVISNLLEKNVPSGIYNVADDEALSTNQVVEILAGALDKKAVLWRVNINLVKFLAKIGDYTKMPLNSERLNKLTENYIVNNKKIKEVIKDNLPLKSDEGLVKTATSFDVNE